MYCLFKIYANQSFYLSVTKSNFVFADFKDIIRVLKLYQEYSYVTI